MMFKSEQVRGLCDCAPESRRARSMSDFSKARTSRFKNCPMTQQAPLFLIVSRNTLMTINPALFSDWSLTDPAIFQ